MGLTRAQCKALGIEHLYPEGDRGVPHANAPAVMRPAASRAPDDGLNKLERAFWERLRLAERAGYFDATYCHAMKLQVIGTRRWYTPDFEAMGHDATRLCIYEVKGWMREDAELKLIAAAARYPFWDWALVRRVRREWELRTVTAAGIGREVWCPEWLE